MQGLLKEAGTPERIAKALALGDRPEDALSTDTPGVKVRRYLIVDMLSYLFRRWQLTQSQYAAGIAWREDWYNSGSTQRLISRLEPPVSGGEPSVVRNLDARRRYEKASLKLSQAQFGVAFDVCMEDRPVGGRRRYLIAALDVLARHYGT